MIEFRESRVDLEGVAIRVWQAGSGPKVGYFAGFGGLSKWSPFLDILSQSRTVVVPSLPGFPGGGRSHTTLDSHLDWIVASRRILQSAGLEGCDFVGSSVGGCLAAELAALWPKSIRRLCLVSPVGIFLNHLPPSDIWAQPPNGQPSMLYHRTEAQRGDLTEATGSGSVDSAIERSRSQEAAARMLWPLMDTGLVRRLPMIECPTLLIWGEQDRVLHPSYAEVFNKEIGGRTKIEMLADAGHLAEFDQPERVAALVRDWTD